MTQVSSLVRVTDIATNTVIATVNKLFTLDYSSEVSKPGNCAYTISFGNTVAQGVVTATGGANAAGAFKAYLLEFSLDGGVSYDVRTMVLSPIRTDNITESGYTLFYGYSMQLVDRLTLQNVTLSDALYGQMGTIIPQSLGTAPQEFGMGLPLQYVQGLFRQQPGLASWAGRSNLVYTPVVDSAIASILVDGDVYADFIDNALNAFLAHVAGVYIPGDTAPFGTRGTWVEDSSDAALNLTGYTRGLAIGHVGNTPVGAFKQVVSSASDAKILEINGPLPLQAHLDLVDTTYAPVGGTTNHGLPEGAKISSPVVLRTGHGPNAIDWDDSLCVFCADDGAGSGGVYFWAHDGNAYIVGQPLPGAVDLAYSPQTDHLYVATQSGCYSHNADVTDTTPWQRVGGLASPVKRMQIDMPQGGSSVNALIVAEVSGSGSGGDGLYIYPGLDSSGATAGYYGWSMLQTGSTASWAYHYIGDELEIIDPNDPSAIIQIIGATDTLTPPATRRVVTPTGASITELQQPGKPGIYWLNPPTNTVKGGSVVLTAAGAFGFYLLNPDGILVDLNQDLSLVDTSGNAPIVNRAFFYGSTIRIDGSDLYVTWVACTDSGPYVSAHPLGGSWMAMGAQSGVANVNFTGLAIGSPQTLVDRVISRLYGATDQGLYVSHSGGRYWDNETADPLTVGGYLTALGRLIGYSPFLTNDITSIGTIGVGGTTNVTGTNVPGPLPAPYTLAGDLVWVRALDYRSKWVYKLMHTLTASPYGKTEAGEISELSTTASTGAATASGRLGQVETRYMAVHSVPQLTLTIDSSFSQTNHFLRKLRASQMVTVSYNTTPIYGINLSNTPMYVLSHRIYKGTTDTVCNTQTVLGTQYRPLPLTPDEIAQGIAYTVSRVQRYRT